MASHCGLQYLLLLDEAIVQVQTGCAHFSVFSVAIVFSCPDRELIIQARMLVVSLRNNCPQKYTPELCGLNQLRWNRHFHVADLRPVAMHHYYEVWCEAREYR